MPHPPSPVGFVNNGISEKMGANNPITSMTTNFVSQLVGRATQTGGEMDWGAVSSAGSMDAMEMVTLAKGFYDQRAEAKRQQDAMKYASEVGGVNTNVPLNDPYAQQEMLNNAAGYGMRKQVATMNEIAASIQGMWSNGDGVKDWDGRVGSNNTAVQEHNLKAGDLIAAYTKGSTGGYNEQEMQNKAKDVYSKFGVNSSKELNDLLPTMTAADIVATLGSGVENNAQLNEMKESLGFAFGERNGLIEEKGDKYYSTETGKMLGSKWSEPERSDPVLFGQGVISGIYENNARAGTIIEINRNNRTVSINGTINNTQTYELRMDMQKEDAQKSAPALALGMLATVAMPEVAPAIATSVAKFAGLTTKFGGAMAEIGVMSVLNGGVGVLSNGITNKMNKDDFTENGLSAFTFGAVTGFATTGLGKLPGNIRYPATFSTIFAGDIAQTAWNDNKSLLELNKNDYIKAGTSAILGTKVIWMTGSMATTGIPWSQTGFASTILSMPMTIGNDCIWNKYKH